MKDGNAFSRNAEMGEVQCVKYCDLRTIRQLVVVLSLCNTSFELFIVGSAHHPVK